MSSEIVVASRSHMTSERPPGKFSGRLRTSLDALATLLLIVAAALVAWRNWPSSPPGPALPTSPVSLLGAAVEGNPAARVAVIEYSDFQCPFCGRFSQETRPTLAKEYIAAGKILWAFRHLPIERRHPLAFGASEVAECANRQGKFWAMHKDLFDNQKELGIDSVLTRAPALGLDATLLTECLAENPAAAVRRDIAAAREIGIRSTPTFLVGTVQSDGKILVTDRISGAVDLATFRLSLDQRLKPASPWGFRAALLVPVSFAAVVAFFALRRLKKQRAVS